MLCACGAEANEYNPVYLVSSKTIYSVNGNTDSQSTYEYDKSETYFLSLQTIQSQVRSESIHIAITIQMAAMGT